MSGAEAAAGEAIVRRGDVSLKRTGDEGLLLDERSGKVHVLNGTAAEVWELCSSSPTLDGLTAGLARAHALDAATVREDVERVVERFRELGLLEPGA
jgi:PqqD family protein of HPr-rel-A system